MRLTVHKKKELWEGWALFLVGVAGSVTVTGLEVLGRGWSGPQKSQPEPSLVDSFTGLYNQLQLQYMVHVQ